MDCRFVKVTYLDTGSSNMIELMRLMEMLVVECLQGERGRNWTAERARPLEKRRQVDISCSFQLKYRTLELQRF